jgi:hypothetical protein
MGSEYYKVAQENQTLSQKLGKMVADSFGMQDGALVRDLRAENQRLAAELEEERKLLKDAHSEE